MARSSSTVWTERRSVNGGWTETSSGPTSAGVSRRPRSWTVRMDWRWSWCIFQLPLTSGRRRSAPGVTSAIRGGVGGVTQRHQTGKVPVLEKLERRPAAHHAETTAAGDGPGHGVGARREAGVFEDAHGTVPEDGLGLGHHGGEALGAAGPDVETHRVIGEVGTDHLDLL